MPRRFFHCHCPSHHRHLSVCLPRARQGSRTRLGPGSCAFAMRKGRTLRSGPADLTRSDSFSFGKVLQQRPIADTFLAEWFSLRQSSSSFFDFPCACGVCACAMSGCGRGFHGSAFLGCRQDLSAPQLPDSPTGNKPEPQGSR